MDQSFELWKKENGFKDLVECCASCIFGQDLSLGHAGYRSCNLAKQEVTSEEYVRVRDFSYCGGWKKHEFVD